MHAERIWSPLTRACLAEAGVVVQCNRWCACSRVALLFGSASRLGDGWIWYLLLVMLPLATGRWDVGLAMPAIGLLATTIYKVLKGGCRRPRPMEVQQGLLLPVPPLDRWSFPSGHTLHAVAFTVMAVSAVPGLGWLLVPFTIVVALSRLVLGLHYPSDVIAGALIGAAVAGIGVVTTGLLGVQW
jgi:undecaprenyl-diphosphatase